MNYEKVKLRPGQFESVTSLRLEEFHELLPVFEQQLRRHLRKTSRGTVRRNAMRYPNSLPTSGHLLFFTLTYIKLNPLQEQHGASFDMSQESVSRWFKTGEKSLHDALCKLDVMPHRDGATLGEVLKKNASKRPISVL